MAWLLVLNGDTLRAIEESLESLHRKVNKLMAQVQVAQEDLDALDSSLDEATSALSAHIDELVAAAGAQLPEGSLDALKADVDALRALSAPAAAPEEPPAE